MTGRACAAEAALGAEIVALARGWIGTPYRHQASCRGAGTDCLGLLRGLWRETLGAEPESVPAYTADWSEPARSEDLLAAAARHLVPVAGEARAGRRAGAAHARGRRRQARRHPRALGGRPCDAHPCLFGARGGRVAADAGLGAADCRRLSLSGENLMATLLLSAAGTALGGALGGSVAGLGTMAIGKAAGALIGSAIDQRILGAGSAPVETGKVERFRVMGSSEGAALPRVFGRCRVAGQVIWSSRFLETVQSEEVGGKGGGGTSGPRVQLFGEPRARALRGRGRAGRADLGRRAADRPVGADPAAARRVGGPAARPADRGDRGRRAGLSRDGLSSSSRTSTSRPTATVSRSSTSRSSADRRWSAAGRAAAAGARHPGRGAGARDGRVCARDRAGALSARAWARTPVAERPQRPGDAGSRRPRSTSWRRSCRQWSRCRWWSTWFGDDLRCGRCRLRPAVEQVDGGRRPDAWVVSGQGRGGAADGEPCRGAAGLRRARRPTPR